LKADGIVGLAPTSKRAQLFIESLVNDGAIENNIFAFSLGKNDEPSSITIGGYEPVGNVVPGTPIVWHKLVDVDYWSLNFNNPMIGTLEIQTNIKKMIVDTGTSFNLVPANDFQ
jgi:hypothetical protein